MGVRVAARASPPAGTPYPLPQPPLPGIFLGQASAPAFHY